MSHTTIVPAKKADPKPKPLGPKAPVPALPKQEPNKSPQKNPNPPKI